MTVACLLLPVFRFFERSEHDFQSKLANGTVAKITHRIQVRFLRNMPADIPRQEPSGKKKWLIPPFGFPTIRDGRLFNLCRDNRTQLDYFTGTGATTQWFPANPVAWLFLPQQFDRIIIGHDLGHPIYTVCLKFPSGEDHPTWISQDFFHFFLGGLVEGTVADCTESGRFAIMIRAATSARAALFIDNGLPRPGFEYFARIFDRKAELVLQHVSGHQFQLKNPPGAQLDSCCQGLFAPDAGTLNLIPGESIRFKLDHTMDVQMRLPPKVKLQPSNLSILFASLLA